MAAMNMVSTGGFLGVSFHLRTCPRGVASVLCKKTPIFGPESRRSKLDHLTVRLPCADSKLRHIELRAVTSLRPAVKTVEKLVGRWADELIYKWRFCFSKIWRLTPSKFKYKRFLLLDITWFSIFGDFHDHDKYWSFFRVPVPF
jgi:hypothetical protein